MEILKKIFAWIGLIYLASVAISLYAEPNFLGAIGQSPLALLGRVKSINYMYEYSSYENYDQAGKLYWQKRGADAGIPMYQRLYAGRLLKSCPVRGLALLAKSADGGDYYAAAELADLYGDDSYPLKNPALAEKYQALAARLERRARHGGTSTL
jgi:hypothetical protein